MKGNEICNLEKKRMMIMMGLYKQKMCCFFNVKRCIQSSAEVLDSSSNLNFFWIAYYIISLMKYFT